uniref:Uncharacterized protein n=1 Tax=Rhipicephalus zambeziensis TaxID=60191 RepID=A0A224YIE1_9ACAR
MRCMYSFVGAAYKRKILIEKCGKFALSCAKAWHSEARARCCLLCQLFLYLSIFLYRAGQPCSFLFSFLFLSPSLSFPLSSLLFQSFLSLFISIYYLLSIFRSYLCLTLFLPCFHFFSSFIPSLFLILCMLCFTFSPPPHPQFPFLPLYYTILYKAMICSV